MGGGKEKINKEEELVDGREDKEDWGRKGREDRVRDRSGECKYMWEEREEGEFRWKGR